MSFVKTLLYRIAKGIRKHWVITGIGFVSLVIVMTVFLQPLPVLRLLARNSEVLFFYPTSERVVALTIDDAPHPQVTPRILDVLKENGAHATFFVMGDHVPGNMAILERARREGHELGNHLVHEYPSIMLAPDEFDREIMEVDALIQPHGPMKWLRPGSGLYSRRLVEQAKQRGYRCAIGSVYPFDTFVRNRWLISTYIKSQVFPGAIIIIHDGKPDRIRTVDVLARVLPELRASGYRVVTLSELVKLDQQPK